MSITSVTFYVVARQVWGWSRGARRAAAGGLPAGRWRLPGREPGQAAVRAPGCALLIGGLVFAMLVICTVGRTQFRRADGGPVHAAGRVPADGAVLGKPGRKAAPCSLTENADKVADDRPGTSGCAAMCGTRPCCCCGWRRPKRPPRPSRRAAQHRGGRRRHLPRRGYAFGFMHPPDLAGALSHGLPFDLASAVFFLPSVVVQPAPTWWARLVAGAATCSWAEPG